MDPQQLLATLIQLSDEQQQRIAELLNRLEQQTRTLTTASKVRSFQGLLVHVFARFAAAMFLLNTRLQSA